MNEIKKEHITEFKRCTTMLDNLIKKIRSYHPNIEYYVADGEINLMKGPSHTGPRDIKCPENVIRSVKISYMDCGAW